MNLLKRPLVVVLLVAVVVSVVMVTRALRLERAPVSTAEAPPLELDQRRLCERLSRAIQIASVSASEPSALELGRLEYMADYVVDTFAPLVEQLEFERHSRSLVFRWSGTEPELDPLLLLAHLDVVPVEQEALEDWTLPPFSGEITGGFIWGRGTLDDKGSALAILEAIEHLLTDGFRPRRSVIVAIGMDEEIGGSEGAAALALQFEEEGLEPYLILDEGFAVLDGVIDTVPGLVAGIGIAEKGAIDLELRVELEGGHSSMPERQTSLGVLAKALSALESEPMDAEVDGVAALFFDELAREMEFWPKLLITNRWITEPLLLASLESSASTAALLRTTTAVTMAHAGVAPNVLPEVATASVNFRIHSRDSIDSVMEHVRSVIDDPRVQISVMGEPWESSSISPVEGPAWTLLETTIRECYPGVQVAPTLVLGATDARHYAGLSKNVYRFNGIRLGPEDLSRIHGTDERISTRNYLEMIRFYARLIERA